MASTDEELLQRLVAQPNDGAVRAVYADHLESRGDARAAFLREQGTMRALTPEHPDRFAAEERLSHARRDLDPAWLLKVEPERAHLLTGQPARCECVGSKAPQLHDEPQDTLCDPWRKLVELVDRAVSDQPEELAPLSSFTADELRWIVTLPPAIAGLKSLRRLVLYGSQLVRVPTEIGELTSLRSFEPYTSYRLHWFPWEITRCGYQSSTVSTRALFGNFKFRSTFPDLAPSTVPAATRPCSVCQTPFADRRAYRVWVSLRVGSDVLPLLVNACSQRCVDRLPMSPEGYVRRPHRGGPTALPQKRR